METLSRRNLLKTGLLIPAAAAAQGVSAISTAIDAAGKLRSSSPQTPEESANLAAPSSAARNAGRDRLLLDFGWSFHLGNADDSSKDFDFGTPDNPAIF